MNGVKSKMKEGAMLAIAARTIVVSVLFYSVASAQSDADWQKVVEAAKKEGAVTIYSSQSVEQLNDLAARFKSKYGIPVRAVRSNPAVTFPKIDIEFKIRNGDGADIIVASDRVSFEERSPKGYAVPVKGPNFDNPLYKRKLHIPEGTYFAVGKSLITFGWNTDLYPKGIKDYPDFLDPALRGKIGLIRPIVSSFVDFWTYIEDRYGTEFLVKLAAQKPRFYESAAPSAQAVVSGEIAANLFGQPMIDEKRQGAPVDWAMPPRGPWGSTYYAMVLKAAPHPNAAQLLADFIVSREGQEAVTRTQGSVLPNVPGAILQDEEIYNTDPARITPQYVEAYQKKWNAIFGAK